MNLPTESPLLTGKDLDLAEALGFGGMTTVVGLSIVFGVLLMLMIVLYLFKVIFAKKSSQNIISQAQMPRNQQQQLSVSDEEELIAVLTAAAAACMNTSPKKVRINTYKRVHTDPPVWNRAARHK